MHHINYDSAFLSFGSTRDRECVHRRWNRHRIDAQRVQGCKSPGFKRTTLKNGQECGSFTSSTIQDDTAYRAIPKDILAYHRRHRGFECLGRERRSSQTASAWSEAPHMLLQDLYCLESARGTGVGRALIEATEKAAREAGCERLDSLQSCCEWLDRTHQALLDYESGQYGCSQTLDSYDSTATCEFVVYRMPLKQ